MYSQIVVPSGVQCLYDSEAMARLVLHMSTYDVQSRAFNVDIKNGTSYKQTMHVHVMQRYHLQCPEAKLDILAVIQFISHNTLSYNFNENASPESSAPAMK